MAKQHTVDTSARYIFDLEIGMLLIDLDPYWLATDGHSEGDSDTQYGHLPHYWLDKAQSRAFFHVWRCLNKACQESA